MGTKRSDAELAAQRLDKLIANLCEVERGLHGVGIRSLDSAARACRSIEGTARCLRSLCRRIQRTGHNRVLIVRRRLARRVNGAPIQRNDD